MKLNKSSGHSRCPPGGKVGKKKVGKGKGSNSKQQQQQQQQQLLLPKEVVLLLLLLLLLPFGGTSFFICEIYQKKTQGLRNRAGYRASVPPFDLVRDIPDTTVCQKQKKLSSNIDCFDCFPILIEVKYLLFFTRYWVPFLK